MRGISFHLYDVVRPHSRIGSMTAFGFWKPGGDKTASGHRAEICLSTLRFYPETVALRITFVKSGAETPAWEVDVGPVSRLVEARPG